ncbi:MAG: glucose 1-dehydrogenase [Anaerolineae bacterium]|nr:glucose 1-dehydrogenase [Anaerolineae bacterium]NIN97193.1 glucose 1-dehydrogenase [Anaerolineae bacterium]NIQ82811.1 glucose 1-dehydrogenase [Anaerolineae bacterium]
MSLEGKVAVVTGAAQGIGKAIALRLAKQGADVVVADLNVEKAKGVADQVATKMRRRAIAIKTDVADGRSVQALVEQIIKEFGRIDILVNNAAIIRRGSLETMTDQDWHDVVGTNLTGVYYCCRAMVPIMKGQGSGKIVNISSVAGKTGDITSSPGYGPSKAGIDCLTKSLARELAPHGINVNAVAPHAIETEMSAQWSEEKRKEVVSAIPLGRMGKPEEVAEVVAFLASDRASFITGEIIDVNGGFLMD